jgi:hypothetical protein
MAKKGIILTNEEQVGYVRKRTDCDKVFGVGLLVGDVMVDNNFYDTGNIKSFEYLMNMLENITYLGYKINDFYISFI